MARTLKEASQEIVVLKRRIKELEELSVDELTGLPRRKVFQEAVEKEIRRCMRTKQAFSLFVIDLNYMKTVNDTHGHQAGDKMITSFASCLRVALRECDIVARTGGDEFMVLTPDQSEIGARAVKNHLLQKFKESELAIPFFNGAAIGMATFGNDCKSFKEMYDKADKAMYAHKKVMKNCA